MQLREKSRKSRNIVIIIVAALFVLGGGGLFYWLSLSQPKDVTPPEPPVPTENIGAPDNQVNSEQTDDYNKDVSVPAGTTEGTVTPTITFAQESDQMVSVGSFFNAPASGECELTLSKIGQPDVVKITSVQAQAQYICQFWDVPVPSSGGWTAKLVNVNGANRSTAAEIEVSL